MRRLLATALCLWTVTGARVFAQPMVHVRAESRIELSVARVSGGIGIDAVLRDDLGTPLADRDLTVRLSPRAHDAIPNSARRRTDATGKVHVEFALPTGDYEIGAQFPGDEDHDRAEVARPLDLTRADVRLRISVPNEGRFSREDPSPVLIGVAAESVEGGAGLAVSLTDELGRPLSNGTTDAHGHVEFRMLVSELGPASAGRLVAHSAADTRRAEAQTEVPIVRITATSVTLALSARSARPGDTIRVSGDLRDGRAESLPRAAIGIFSGERHVASALTDEHGHYDVPVTLQGVDDDVTFVSRFDSDAPWRVSSSSEPVRLSVRSFSFMPLLWAILTTLVTAGVVWFVARRAPKPQRIAPDAVVVKRAGVEHGARNSQRMDCFDVSGVVMDTHDVPAPDAQIELRLEGGASATLHTDADGAFHSEPLQAGSYALVASAPGFSSLTVSVTIPHRGDWARVRVRLVNLRKLALDAIHPVAAEVLPKGTWGVTTPREVLDAAAAKGVRAPALPALASKVEVAGYARTPPTEALLVEVEQARDETLAAIQPKPRPPKA